MEKKKKTVGAAALELREKSLVSPPTHTVEEQGREQLSDYERNVMEATAAFRKKNPATDFFVVVLTKHEKLFGNVMRNYFMARHTCPLPNYDQTVFRYTHHDEQLYLLWTLPNRDACFALRSDPLQFADIDEQLKRFVFDFADGTLSKKAKLLNKEDELKTGIALEVQEGVS